MLGFVASSLSPGDRIGPYVALFRLGKGGMGEVWAASPDGEPSAPLVALKVFAQDRAGENETLMFYDEARAASALEHPAIVATSPLGSDGGRPYLPMELVPGPSLTTLLQRLVIDEDVFEPALVAYVGIQIGAALDYAYRRATLDGKRLKLIHRDVSPHNVLLDLEGGVRLSDFGVARTDVQDHLSRVGTVRGKPSYMAPEQVTSRDLDDRTDVFALGIVLYESSSLKRLFGRKHPVKSMDAVLRYQPKPLSQLVPGFPPALSDAIAKALEKDPRRRHRNAESFVAALADAAKDLPGMADAPRRLADKIRAHFDADELDVSARAEEGWAIIRQRAALVAPTQLQEVEEVHTRLWPSEPAEDPLDPDVIEELRTRLRPGPVREASFHPPIVVGDPTEPPVIFPDTRASYASFGSYPSTSQRRPGAGRWVAIAMTAAAVLSLMAVGVVLSRRGSWNAEELGAREPLQPLRPSAPAPSIAAQPRPTVSADPSRPAPEPVEETAAKEATRAPEPRRQRSPRRRTVPRTPDLPGAAGSAASAESATEAAPPRNATFEEVRELVRQVQAVDAELGGAMLATLVEAGSGNTEALNRLRARARARLAQP